jgi:hypothetical protein
MKQMAILLVLFFVQTTMIFAGKSLKEQFDCLMEMRKDITVYTEAMKKEITEKEKKQPADKEAFIKSFCKRARSGTKLWKKMFTTHQKLEDNTVKIDTNYEKGYSNSMESLWKYGDYHMEAIDAVQNASYEKYTENMSTAKHRLNRALGRLEEYKMYMDDYAKKYLKS